MNVWISSVSVAMSPFSFLNLLTLILSSCPLVSLAKGLSTLLIFFNEAVPGLVDSLYSSFCFYFVDLNPKFDDFLPSSPLRCVCLFSY